MASMHFFSEYDGLTFTKDEENVLWVRTTEMPSISVSFSLLRADRDALRKVLDELDAADTNDNAGAP